MEHTEFNGIGTSKENPKLSSKTVKEIEAARERMKRGEFYTEKQMAEQFF